MTAYVVGSMGTMTGGRGRLNRDDDRERGRLNGEGDRGRGCLNGDDERCRQSFRRGNNASHRSCRTSTPVVILSEAQSKDLSPGLAIKSNIPLLSRSPEGSFDKLRMTAYVVVWMEAMRGGGIEARRWRASTGVWLASGCERG